jgi:type I restriction enzyme S subunit
MERDIYREIALIQELRTRLIADVVTGKLDVRAVATTLPEAIDLEPIEEPADIEEVDEIDDSEDEEVAA